MLYWLEDEKKDSEEHFLTRLLSNLESSFGVPGGVRGARWARAAQSPGLKKLAGAPAVFVPSAPSDTLE